MAFKTYGIQSRNRYDLYRDGMPFRSKIQNLASATYAAGQAIAGLSPGVGQMLYVEDFTFTSSVAGTFDIYGNGGGPALGYTFTNKRYTVAANQTVNVPIRDFVPEGQTIGLITVNILTSAVVSCSISGTRLCNDNNMNAKRRRCHIGDSNTNTTILNAIAGDNYYHAHAANLAMDAGASIYRVMKGEGGATSDNANYYLYGKLIPWDCSLYTYMFGTNDSFGLSQFQQPFQNFLRDRKRYAPKSKLLILGPPYRGDGGGAGQETNLIAIRAYIVAQMPNIMEAVYYDMNDPDVPHNTTYSPDGVHWIGAAHNIWGQKIYDMLETKGWNKF